MIHSSDTPVPTGTSAPVVAPPVKVLLVEDNAADARLVREMLASTESGRFRLTIGETLAAGIGHLGREPFDVVLLDLGLPDSQGLESLHRLSDRTDTPIVVITGLNDAIHGQEAIRAGAQDFLGKENLNSSQLVRTIRYAMERGRLRSELAASELRWHSLLESSADGIVVVTGGGVVRFINRAAEQMFGRQSGEMLGQNFGFPVSGPASVEIVLRTSGNRQCVVEMRVAEVQWEGATCYMAMLRDITRRKEAEEALARTRDELELRVNERTAQLAQANTRLEQDVSLLRRLEEERRVADEKLRMAAKIFESAGEGIVVTDTAGTIVATNPAFTAITGYGAGEVIGRNPRLLQSARHDKSFYRELWLALARQGEWAGEIWNRRKNGEIYPEWLHISAIRDEAGKIVQYVGVFYDISARVLQEEQLRRLAFHDPLTGLPNRLLFLDRLRGAVGRAQRGKTLAAVLFIDIDRFKPINDTYGHHVGDQLLKSVADRMTSALRAVDTCSRLGGDEFTVLLENLRKPDDAMLVTKKLYETLQAPLRLGDHHLTLTLSIGVSLYPDDDSVPENLIAKADAAMYSVKMAGRNGYVRFESSMDESKKKQ